MNKERGLDIYGSIYRDKVGNFPNLELNWIKSRLKRYR